MGLKDLLVEGVVRIMVALAAAAALGGSVEMEAMLAVVVLIRVSIPALELLT
jgi:hypothetical protein